MSLTAAIISRFWAMDPEALEALVAIAERRMDDATLVRMRERAIEEGRWPPRPEALLLPGATPMAGAPPRTYQREAVGIIPVMGPIIPHANLFSEVSGASSVDGLTASLRSARGNPDIRTIAMVFDSPGGAVTGIKDLADRIAATNAEKKVESYVYGAGASAAYWLATAASTITLGHTAGVGSIGVAAVAQVQQAADRNGNKRVEIVSTNAPNKRPDLTSEAGVAHIRETIDRLESVFVGDVAANRHVTREKVLADFGKGGMLIGQQAVDVGMADGVMAFDAWLDSLVSANKQAPKEEPRKARAERFLAERR